MYGDDDFWFPGFVAARCRAGQGPTEGGGFELTPEEKLQHAIAGARPASRSDLAVDDMDLGPFGIMDLLDDPACLPREGLDVRVHGRYYRDPPEFLTFMHGGTDGLHFGLWYDDGRTCTGVASYYNNDGGGVGLPSGTPLETVREQIEWRQAHLDSEAGEDEPIAADLAEERFRLRRCGRF